MVIGAVIVAPLAQVVVSAVAALVSLSSRVHVANVASYTVSPPAFPRCGF